jgi:hypothetical protein
MRIVNGAPLRREFVTDRFTETLVSSERACNCNDMSVTEISGVETALYEVFSFQTTVCTQPIRDDKINVRSIPQIP